MGGRLIRTNSQEALPLEGGSSGAPQSIASGDPAQIDLTTPEVPTINVATPSALAADGQSFNVCVYAESCAAPS